MSSSLIAEMFAVYLFHQRQRQLRITLRLLQKLRGLTYRLHFEINSAALLMSGSNSLHVGTLLPP